MNTGVVRKIDELGRIVIPKEIRKTLNIRNGEDVQIYIENNKIILKKYERLLTIKDKAQKYLNEFKKITDSLIVITDKDKVISSNDNSYIDKYIDSKTKSILEERKHEVNYGLKIENEVFNNYYYLLPILVNADLIGSIIVISKNAINDSDKILANILNTLILLDVC